MNNRQKIATDHFKYTDKLTEIAKEFAISPLAIETDEEIDDRHLIDEFTTNKRIILGYHIDQGRTIDGGIH